MNGAGNQGLYHALRSRPRFFGDGQSLIWRVPGSAPCFPALTLGLKQPHVSPNSGAGRGAAL